ENDGSSDNFSSRRKRSIIILVAVISLGVLTVLSGYFTWRKRFGKQGIIEESFTGTSTTIGGEAGSGHKRRRGSAQPSPSGVKKTKKEIDRDYREKRKGEMNELKKENKILQESKWRFLGQMDQMKMELRERGEEIISLRIKLDRHDNSLRNLNSGLVHVSCVTPYELLSRIHLV
ncbi:hypothetical protein D5086_033875, partial [Populus alba]